MIIYRKRNTQAKFNIQVKNFTDTIKPLSTKSSLNEETNHELIYPNPTYEDHEGATHELIYPNPTYKDEFSVQFTK